MNNPGSIPQLPQTIQSGELEKELDEAINLSNKFLNNSYELQAIVSLNWHTGGKEDCQKFVKKISSLCATTIYSIHTIGKTDKLVKWVYECESLIEQIEKTKRTLFIVHYAGHVAKDSTSESLTLAATITEANAEAGEEDERLRRDFNFMKSFLLKEAKVSLLMDVLMVMDCCCTAAGGRGSLNSGRVEFVAATTETGTANAKTDGQTFTEAWCHAIHKLKDEGLEFGVQNVVNVVNDDRKLAQYPKLFVLQQGKGLPIIFLFKASEAHLPKNIKLPVVVVAYRLQEDPESNAVKNLLKHLQDSPCPISVVASIASSSTLLLISMPAVLLKFLPHYIHKSIVVFWTLPKMVVVDNNLLVTVDSISIGSAG